MSAENSIQFNCLNLCYKSVSMIHMHQPAHLCVHLFLEFIFRREEIFVLTTSSAERDIYSLLAGPLNGEIISDRKTEPKIFCWFNVWMFHRNLKVIFMLIENGDRFFWPIKQLRTLTVKVNNIHQYISFNIKLISFNSKSSLAVCLNELLLDPVSILFFLF